MGHIGAEENNHTNDNVSIAHKLPFQALSVLDSRGRKPVSLNPWTFLLSRMDALRLRRSSGEIVIAAGVEIRSAIAGAGARGGAAEMSLRKSRPHRGVNEVRRQDFFFAGKAETGCSACGILHIRFFQSRVQFERRELVIQILESVHPYSARPFRRSPLLLR